MKNRNKRIISLALAGVLTAGVPVTARALNEPTEISQNQEEDIEYTVQEGDTLGNIAERLYGNAAYYVELATYNKMDDPNKLFVGQIIRIPRSLPRVGELEIEYVEPIVYEDDVEYVVESGDVLENIAKRFYNRTNGSVVDRLATYNDMCDPNILEVGQVLLIPCIDKLLTITPNDYSEEYNRMAWRLEHPNCEYRWHEECIIVSPCEYVPACDFVPPCPPAPCFEMEHHHHHHHHDCTKVLKP